MGNQQNKKSQTLEEFIVEADVDSLKTVDDTKLEAILYDVYKKFKDDPKVFDKIKEKEVKESEEAEANKLKAGEEEKGSEKEETKSEKFRRMLYILLFRKYEKETVYLLTLRLVRNLLQDEQFNNHFKTLIEDFCSNLTLIGAINDYSILRETCLLFDDYIKYHSQNLTVDILSFTKIFFLFKRINTEGYLFSRKCFDMLIVFSSLINSLFNYANQLYKKSLKRKFAFQKEKEEQIKIFFNELNQCEIFIVMSKLFDNQRVENCVFEIDVEAQIKNENTKIQKQKNIKKQENTVNLTDTIIEEFNNDLIYYKKYTLNTQIDFNTTPHFLLLNAFNNFIGIPFNFEEKVLRNSNMVELIYEFFVKNIPILKDDKLEEFRKKYYYALSEKITNSLVNHIINYLQYDPLATDTAPYINLTKPSFYEDINSIFSFISYLIQKETTAEEENETAENLKLNLCIFFYCLGINRKIWKIFQQKEYAFTLNGNIILYIKRTFKVNQKALNERRIINLQTLVYFFTFIILNKIRLNIHHADYFESLLPIPCLLFYINYPLFRTDILKILNIFTLYEKCKEKMISENYTKVCTELYDRIIEQFEELKDSNIVSEDLQRQKEDILNQKGFLNKGGDRLEVANRLTKLDENFRITNSLYNNAKNTFLTQFNEFGLLISIFVNLMIQDRYEESIVKLCCNNPQKMLDLFHYEDVDDKFVLFKKDDTYIGQFFKFFSYFKNTCTFRDLVFNTANVKENDYLKNYVMHISLAIFIHSPDLYICVEGDTLDREKPELNNLNSLISLFRENVENYEIIQKILFALVRFFKKKNESKEIYEIVKDFMKDIRIMLEKKDLPIYTAREIFKLFNSILTVKDNCVLWMKFDNKKYGLDSTHLNSIFEKTKREDKLNMDPKNRSLLLKGAKDEKGANTEEFKNNLALENKIIPLPYKKIKAYKDKYGVVTYDEHHFELVDPIMLSNQSDDSYTISFFFYNPVVSTGRLHVLLQDENGVYPIIAIDASGTRIGCFDISGHFVDSGIHLEEQKYRDKWLHFTMIYDSYTIEDKVKLHGVVTFYLDGINTEQIESDGVLNQKKVYSWNGKEAKEEKPAYIDLPKTIKYIGNSKDYKHPFGPFCDL